MSFTLGSKCRFEIRLSQSLLVKKSRDQHLIRKTQESNRLVYNYLTLVLYCFGLI